MMNDDVFYAMMVLDEYPITASESFGFFKRELEDILGRVLEPDEAQNLYEMAKKELA